MKTAMCHGFVQLLIVNSVYCMVSFFFFEFGDENLNLFLLPPRNLGTIENLLGFPHVFLFAA